MNETRGLWRGKRIDDGEWVSGDMSRLISKNRYYIEDNQEDWVCEVDPSTLGECTGLRDKNGKLIFEGDILRLVYDGTEHIYVVIWDIDELGFKATNGQENYGKEFEYLGCCEEIESIGNIHDNPELLKGEANENV